MVSSFDAVLLSEALFPLSVNTTISLENPGNVSSVPPRSNPRYRFVSLLGAGGTGEVWEVEDLLLKRRLALKLLRRRRLSRPGAAELFLREAQVLASLQHPHIVPVHNFGHLGETGRPFITMALVRGGTLHDAIDGVPAQDTVALRRRIGQVVSIAEAIVYAHERGILHRDLKPSNVVLGELGEVQVADWGLAGSADLSHERGNIVGTIGYMAPEQASAGTAIDARTDVFGLGGVLYHALTGLIPWGVSSAALARARSGERLVIAAPHRFPARLVEICEMALQPCPTQRFQTARACLEALRGWLERQDDLDRGRGLVAEALQAKAAANKARRRAAEHTRAASMLLAPLSPHEPEERRHAGWAEETRASALLDEADILEAQHEQKLHASLSFAPELQAAHAGLAELYAARHKAAEQTGDTRAAARHAYLLQQHSRGRYDSYLQGIGCVSMAASQPAEVLLSLFQERHRRLHPVPQGPRRRLPLVSEELPIGSYLAEVFPLSGGPPVRYPLVISREGHADVSAEALWIPPRELPLPNLVYVPGGLYTCGGDEKVAGKSLPRSRAWVDGFFIGRDPVTNRDYLAFLNALIADGRLEEALALRPRARGAQDDHTYTIGPSGSMVLGTDRDGDAWRLDWPVFLVDFASAQAYTRWLSTESGLPLRLPFELEWEKAARGADSRSCVWGTDTVTATWCRLAISTLPTERGPSSIGDYPEDVSVYGVRGMAGNVSDMCADRFHPSGPEIRDGHWSPQARDTGMFTVRGGNWNAPPTRARLCWRGGSEYINRSPLTGFRLALSASALHE